MAWLIAAFDRLVQQLDNLKVGAGVRLLDQVVDTFISVRPRSC